MISDFPKPDAELGHDPHFITMNLADPDRLYQQGHFGIWRMNRKGLCEHRAQNRIAIIRPITSPRLRTLSSIFADGQSYSVAPERQTSIFIVQRQSWEKLDKGFRRRMLISPSSARR
jgi:hypothetical protein